MSCRKISFTHPIISCKIEHPTAITLKTFFLFSSFLSYSVSKIHLNAIEKERKRNFFKLNYKLKTLIVKLGDIVVKEYKKKNSCVSLFFRLVLKFGLIFWSCVFIENCVVPLLCYFPFIPTHMLHNFDYRKHLIADSNKVCAFFFLSLCRYPQKLNTFLAMWRRMWATQTTNPHHFSCKEFFT